MFCPNCGTKNDDDAVFCGNCGARIIEENPGPAQSSGVSLSKETAQSTPDVQGTTGEPEANGTQPQAAQGAYNAQGMPNMQSQYQQNGMPNQPRQAGTFKLSKKVITLIAAAVAVIVAAVVFVNVGKSATDYKKLAIKYVKAVEEGDWDKAYSLMNLPESEFLTKEAFIKANEEDTTVEIINIAARDLTDVTSLVDSDENLGSKSVVVTYSYAGSSSNVKYVYLDKMNSKAMLFFDKYKVSSDGVVAFDSVIKVPAGSKLYINGTEVSESYKSSNNSTEKIDYYIIPFLFQGDNTIKVTSEYAEDIEEVVNFYGTGDIYSVSSSNMVYKNDMIEAAKTQASQDLEKIAAAAVAQKKFSEVGLGYLTSAESTLSSYYSNLVGDCHTSYKDVQSLKISDATLKASSTNVNVDSSDGLPYIKISVSYNLTGTYIYKYNNETRDGKNSSASATLSYKYNNGQWQMYKMSLSLYIS